MPIPASTCASFQHVLRFDALFDSAPSYAFPCDEAGRVDLDSLNDRTRDDYLHARVVVGHALRSPYVEARLASHGLTAKLPALEEQSAGSAAA